MEGGGAMSVYLGEDGTLLIKRKADTNGLLRSMLDPEDVNPSRNRFSFDFPHEAIISGDRIEIYTANKLNLELVEGHDQPDGMWYAHVDDSGGVRLYDEFEQAINGGYSKALALKKPTHTQEILVRTRNSRFRCQAQMRQWEITTSRANVDVTTLGEEFVEQFARGLISGQGSTTCIWDYRYKNCDSIEESAGSERPHYLCELLLRLKQGALFRGQFFLHVDTTYPYVWYECDCVVTNVGLSFAPGTVVESRVDFVTTGPIELHTGEPDGFILQEDSDLLLQEDNSNLLIEDAV